MGDASVLLLEEIQCSSRQDLDPDGHCILIYIETRMVMWVLRTLCFVLCSYNKVATRNSIKESSHIIAARGPHIFIIIDFIRSHIGNGGLLHHLCHRHI